MENLPRHSGWLLFADDILLYHLISNPYDYILLNHWFIHSFHLQMKHCHTKPSARCNGCSYIHVADLQAEAATLLLLAGCGLDLEYTSMLSAGSYIIARTADLIHTKTKSLADSPPQHTITKCRKKWRRGRACKILMMCWWHSFNRWSGSSTYMSHMQCWITHGLRGLVVLVQETWRFVLSQVHRIKDNL